MKRLTLTALVAFALGGLFGLSYAKYNGPLCVPCQHADGERGFRYIWLDRREASVCWPCIEPYVEGVPERKVCEAIRKGLVE